MGAIIHAINKGLLTRVLLIGDDQQLPPTAMNDKNPFKDTAVISLFERLIQSGADSCMFNSTMQYHSEATISSVVASQIYAKINLTLRNGPRTAMKQQADGKFRTFLKAFGNNMGGHTFGDTNAIVISPVKPGDKDVQVEWTAQMMAGSTSKFNYVTARIVVRTVVELIATGKYKGKDVLVIAFYTDQVQLLQSILSKHKPFDGIRVTTVDGSQGQERPVTVVDCVVMEAANDDGMGFLNADRRRFCVAMMRAQHGRIVVAHKDMRAASSKADPTVWDALMNEARSKKAILDGGAFNAELPSKFVEVTKSVTEAFEKFRRAAARPAKATTERPPTAAPKEYNQMAFIRATGATTALTAQYLQRFNDDLHKAIDGYFQEHENDLPVEEI